MKTNYKFKIIAILMAVLNFSNINGQIVKAEIRATGLTCSMCSNSISKQLKNLPKVISVETELNTNTFIVNFEKENAVNPKMLKDKVEKAGFFIGSLIVTIPVSVSNSNTYISVENKSISAEVIQIQILDKGYVTEKIYKKLLKSFNKIETYSLINENDFHFKIIKK